MFSRFLRVICPFLSIDVLINVILGVLGVFGIPFLFKLYYWITYVPSDKDIYFEIRVRNRQGLPLVRGGGLSVIINHPDLKKYDGILEIRNVSKREILVEEVSLLFPQAAHEDLFRIGTSSPFDLFPEIAIVRSNGAKYCMHSIALNIKIEPGGGQLRNVILPKPPTSKAKIEIRTNREDAMILSPKLESPINFTLRLKCRFIATEWMRLLLSFEPKSIEIERKFKFEVFTTS